MRPGHLSLVAVLVATGCSAATAYRPARVEPNELTVGYDGGFRVATANGQVAEGPRYNGLPEFVACVPEARQHAEEARSWGTTSTVLSGLSIGFAVTGAGGIAGLAYRDEDRGTMTALLLGGLVLETAAIVLGATSIGARSRAHGNALDAVNYYNDSVGATGGTCAGAVASGTASSAPGASP